MLNKVFSYTIKGGSPFRISTPGNPEIVHDGSHSVGHLYCSAGEVSAIGGYISNFGCKFEVWGMQEQTPEQEKERQLLLGVQKEDAVFPSSKCTTCAWFDPLTKSYCGLYEWPEESTKVLLSKPHHANHKDECPSPHIWKKV